MGKNVAVFVDVANIFYAAKAAGVDIDYVTLLKAGSAGRDLVRAYAYTGLDPDNENQRNFHEFLRRHGYKVVSKDIRKYGDGKVKANLDIELVVDMMKTARNLDVAIVVSGDGDFAPAIRAVQEMGVRVEVVSFRGNTSSDLIEVADIFTDITQIAKVEKGSSRSGRRVADDEQDLSMTEVPDKQSEGTGERGRGRGRTRRAPAATPVAAAPAVRGRGRAVAVEAGEAPLMVLPGEKLSRAAVARVVSDVEAVGPDADAELEPEPGEPILAEGGAEDMSTEEGRRRRRRRGGRGRGRARGREDVFAEAPEGAVREAGRVAGVIDEDAEEMPAPARRAASAFGSVWDSQIGIPSGSRGAPIIDDEDFEEPSVPEYLITERRQRDNARGGMRGGGRGRGGAYAAALDRERFGGGRGSTPSRFAQPAPGNREPNFNRSDRPDRIDRGDRQPFRQAPRPVAPRPSGDEPWSEVPPEIEAMLRAQLGSRPAAPRREPAPAPAVESAAPPATEAGTPAPAARRGRRPAAAVAAPVSAETPAPEAGEGTPTAAPKARRTAARTPKAAPAGVVEATEAPASKPARAATKAAPRAAAGRAKAKAEAATGETPTAGQPEAAAPKKRAPRRKAEPEA
ncbi:MAG TPA: NYN domain-containing protein [Frankiaceae bacterium]|nr:NYN domain-containing protein [Frankiaceae bacterium]